jgi:hypothetical protein
MNPAPGVPIGVVAGSGDFQSALAHPARPKTSDAAAATARRWARGGTGFLVNEGKVD